MLENTTKLFRLQRSRTILQMLNSYINLIKMHSKKETAIQFGKYLDEDEFELAKTLVASTCQYEINGQILIGKDKIIDLYKTNMEAGKQKFDELIWGKSDVNTLSEMEYEIYFSDFLKHNGIEHNYKCKQKITINTNGLIEKIVHIELPGEKEKFLDFLKTVGLE